MISVIIPTFNYGHFIEECLRSLSMQEDVDLEIIVVNDGSTDNTERVLERYHDSITYISQENMGSSKARNTGLEVSRGEFIMFLDADDLIAPNSLASRRALLRENSAELAICRSKRFDVWLGNGMPRVTGEWRLPTSLLDIHLCRLNLGPPHAFLMHRSVVDGIGGFDEKMQGCEDYDFWLRALGKGHTPIYSSKGQVFYRRHEDSKGAKKKSAGGYPYDVLVHEKKVSGGYGPEVDRRLETLVGRLALVDGVLTTLLAIGDTENPEGKKSLMAIAIHYLPWLATQTSSSATRLVPEARLYINRILSKERAIAGRGYSEVVDLIADWRKSMHLIGYVAANLITCGRLRGYDRSALGSSTLKMVLKKG